jgi:hypothetical protein
VCGGWESETETGRREEGRKSWKAGENGSWRRTEAGENGGKETELSYYEKDLGQEKDGKKRTKRKAETRNNDAHKREKKVHWLCLRKISLLSSK